MCKYLIIHDIKLNVVVENRHKLCKNIDIFIIINFKGLN